MNFTILTRPCESLKVIARNSSISRSVHVRGGVVVFPVFESYSDQIQECLSALGERKPTRAAVRRVTQTLRRALPGLERVCNSTRHENMARLMRHTLEALRASEWEGARYLLMTGSALMYARAVRTGASLTCADEDRVLQFPVMIVSGAETIDDEAVTGIVTG
jgi:hypothetical protein